MSPSPTAPARRVLLGSLGLAEAKLAPPAVREGTVIRKRLLDRLQASSPAAVISIVAPAGYGKSTLLAQWIALDARPCAWVSLDRRDNDPIVFLSHLAGAVDRIEPVGRSLTRALQAPDASVFGTIVPQLAKELSAHHRPAALILDDIHELCEPVCLDALAALTRSMPRGSVIVLAGRTEPGVPLARSRLEGILLEIDASDLALDDIEAGELLHKAGVELSSSEVADLTRQSEGWAAGLYLAALAMLATDGSPDVSRFTGADRFVTDYLRTELLRSIPPAELRFLRRTAILERLSAPLCDAVLESSSSGARLEQIERKNLMLVPLDHRRVWYRYHHLFRDMLRADLERHEPTLVPQLHLRAAAWYEQDGDGDAAVGHAAAARDLDRVGSLVARFGVPTYRAGRATTVEGWLGLIDDPVQMGRSPWAAIVGANLHAVQGRTADAERWLDAASIGARTDEAVHRGVASVEALMCRHGAEAMLRDARFGAGSGDALRAHNLHLIGVAQLLARDDSAADQAFAEAIRSAQDVDASSIAILSFAERALLSLAKGDIASSERLVEEGRSWSERVGSGGYAPNALLHTAAARVAVQRGRIQRAWDDLVAAHRLRPLLTAAIPWYSVQVRLELARAHLALADREAALMLLSEAREILHVRPDLGVLGGQVEELATHVAAFDDPVSVAWASSLTVAELRLLPLLTTHLTFREIADRLYLSRNTIKTQAISLYRKLGVSSRSEAVVRAAELGLIDGWSVQTATAASSEHRR